MARKKVRLAWIENKGMRKATFKKRKTGLMKKVSELSILCGVEVMAIVTSPYVYQSEVWPSVHEAQQSLARFESFTELDQGKRMFNQEGYLRHKIAKVMDQLKRARNSASELMVEERMGQFFSGRRDAIDDLLLTDLHEMCRKIDATTRMVSERIEVIQGSGPSKVLDQAPSANATDWLTGNKAPPHREKLVPFRAAVDDASAMEGQGQGQQWFMEQQMACGGPEMVGLGASYSDNGNIPWFDAFLPTNVQWP